jgi:Co/Zn/Cd efflux system component
MALERAKAEMQAAAHDYGGHRVEALAACDNAIAQLKLALQYANQGAPGGPQTAPANP